MLAHLEWGQPAAQKASSQADRGRVNRPCRSCTRRYFRHRVMFVTLMIFSRVVSLVTTHERACAEIFSGLMRASWSATCCPEPLWYIVRVTSMNCFLAWFVARVINWNLSPAWCHWHLMFCPTGWMAWTVVRNNAYLNVCSQMRNAQRLIHFVCTGVVYAPPTGIVFLLGMLYVPRTGNFFCFGVMYLPPPGIFFLCGADGFGCLSNQGD